MKYTTLGSTNEKVSVFPIGGMKFGTALDRTTVFSLLDTYMERGGNFIDTADMYAFWLSDDPDDAAGESESVVGAWLKDRGARGRMVITSKVGNPTNRKMAVTGPCLRADYMIASCEKSLKRLDVEQIDLYYAHNDDRSAPMDEVMEAFARLRKEGKIKHIGASNWRAWRIEEARQICEQHSLPFFCCVQQKHSYFQTCYGFHGLWEHPYCDHSFQDYCVTHNLTMFGWEPLLAGMYHPERALDICKYDYRTPNNHARIAVMDEIAGDLGVTRIQLALAWMANSYPPVYPVVAADNAEQLIEDLAAADLELDESHMMRLNHAPLVRGT